MDNKRSYFCDSCKKSFTKKSNLQKHLRTAACGKNDAQREFKCSKCEKTFLRKFTLDRHVKSGVCDKEPIKHQCTSCQSTFSNKRNLKKHILKDHPTKAADLLPNLTCTTCLKTFPQKEHLELHMEKGYCEKREEQHSCRECGKTYKFRKTMLRHMRDFHPEIAPPIKPHRLSDIQEYRCKQCGEVCVNGRELRTHVSRVHIRKPLDTTTERMTTFRCSECDNRFDRKAKLIQHQNENHTTPDSDDEPFERKVKCPHKGCDGQFENRASLVRHKFGHLTPEVEEEALGIGAVFCDFCNKGFEEVEELNKHKMDDHKVPDTCGRVETLFEPIDKMNPQSLYTRVGEHIVDNAGKKRFRTVRTRDSFRLTQKALMLCETGLGMEVLQRVIESLVKDVTRFKRGRIQIKVLADSLDTPIVMPLVPLAVFTPLTLLNYIERVLSSKDQLLLDDTLTFDIIHVDYDF